MWWVGAADVVKFFLYQARGTSFRVDVDFYFLKNNFFSSEVCVLCVVSSGLCRFVRLVLCVLLWQALL